MKNPTRLILLFAAIALVGCQTLSSNVLTREMNSVVVESMDLRMHIDGQYEYVGDFISSEYSRFIKSTKGTEQDMNTMVFINKWDNSFIILRKSTCRGYCHFQVRSHVPEGDGPTSFFVGGRRVYREEFGSITLNLESETQVETIKLLMSADDNIAFTGQFCASAYTTGISKSFFRVGVYTPCNSEFALGHKIADVVKLEKI